MIENDLAAAVAQRYFHSTEPIHCLGWGITGCVYLSPDANTAVKVHRRPESFLTELKAYRKLYNLRINKICGLEIPVLRGSNDTHLLIRMDVVSAPYLLDFAGVTGNPRPGATARGSGFRSRQYGNAVADAIRAKANQV